MLCPMSIARGRDLRVAADGLRRRTRARVPRKYECRGSAGVALIAGCVTTMTAARGCRRRATAAALGSSVPARLADVRPSIVSRDLDDLVADTQGGGPSILVPLRAGAEEYETIREVTDQCSIQRFSDLFD